MQRSIAKYLARDANYLLNVGPKADGTIPAEAAAILRRIGRWYRRTREAFEGTEPASHLTANHSILLTRREDTLYVVLHQDPLTTAVKLKPLAVNPQRATLLNTGRPVSFAVEMLPSDHRDQKVYLRLYNLPVIELAHTVPVVKLEFSRLPK